MKSIGLNRAKVKILEVIQPENNTGYKLIKIAQYRKVLKEVSREVDPDRFNRYKNEINKLRESIRKFDTIHYRLEVYIHKYKKAIIIDIEKEKSFKEMIKEAISRAITVCRVELKWEPSECKFGGMYTAMSSATRKKGRTFMKEGQVLAIYVEKNLKNLYTDKKPTVMKKYIGIELEFCAPIKKNEFAVKLFKAGIYKYAQLKEDGSLRPKDGETAFELAILLEESIYKKQFKVITDILKEVKAVAKDRRCGLHVHLDMRKRNKDLVYNNLVAAQFALLSVVDPRRHNNEFCKIVESRKFPTNFTGDRQERYKTINAVAYYKYKTLEIRMHEGSVDYNEIVNWVDLLIRVARHKKKLIYPITQLDVLNKRIKLNKANYKYNLERACSWQIQNTPEARALREAAGGGGDQNRLNDFLTRARQESIPLAQPFPTEPFPVDSDPYERGDRSRPTNRPQFGTSGSTGSAGQIVDYTSEVMLTTPRTGAMYAMVSNVDLEDRSLTLTTSAAIVRTQE